MSTCLHAETFEFNICFPNEKSKQPQGHIFVPSTVGQNLPFYLVAKSLLKSLNLSEFSQLTSVITSRYNELCEEYLKFKRHIKGFRKLYR